MTKKFLTVIAVWFVLAPALGMNYSQYVKLKSGSQDQQWVAKFYVKGVGDGLLFGNSHLLEAGRTGVYCQPLNVHVTPETYISILEGEIKRAPEVARVDYKIAILLMWGLQRRFPCDEDAGKYPWLGRR